MITDLQFIKKFKGENYYFNLSNTSSSDIVKFADKNNLSYSVDVLEWIYENKRYELQFKDKDFGGSNLLIYNNKIFICYNGISPSFPAPNNLVIYTPTGEIEKILSAPILPTGEQAKGFLEIHGVENLDKNTIPEKFKNGLYVVVWEHERSEWVYSYYFNPETYEFLFLTAQDIKLERNIMIIS